MRLGKLHKKFLLLDENFVQNDERKFSQNLLTNALVCDIIEPSKEREEKTMINIRTLRTLANNDGLTLKAGKPITYKTGWQVATEGKETKDPSEAMKMIKEYNGNCGVWYSEGIYYIDKSKRVNTKKEAMTIGRACNQISVLKWANMSLAYC